MADVTFKGSPVALGGREVKAGQPAPDFSAVDTALQTVRLSDARGKVVILSSVPSLDTPVCDTETRRFNQEAAKLPAGVEVWTISMDLPFAQNRFCSAADISKVQTLSDHRDASFGQNWGVLIKELRLLARAVFVVGADDAVKYVQIVGEVTAHPDYDKALAAAKAAAG